MKQVTKAVIPAAGWGTRLLPGTKAVPKEMMPIINIPTLQYIVQEAVDSGINDILIIISEGKESICKHFGHNYPLENMLKAKGKKEQYKLVTNISKLANITYVYQQELGGLGDAIRYAKEFTKDEPFAVLLGDDVVVSETKPALKQCLEVFNDVQHTILGVQKVNKDNIDKYGIVKPLNTNDLSKKVFALKDVVEKPKADKAPSNVAILGRYIFTPDIYKALENTPKDKTGELQLTDAIKLMLRNNQDVYACSFTGNRYDLGAELGVVKAVIDFALADKTISKEVKQFIKTRCK